MIDSLEKHVHGVPKLIAGDLRRHPLNWWDKSLITGTGAVWTIRGSAYQLQNRQR
jgi:hypothetical protein